MPTTNFELRTPSVRALSEFQPFTSMLDIGCGFGSWGWLTRQYFDVWEQRYHKEEWQIKIDAIEIHEPYITPLHKYLYDDIYIGDALSVVPSLKNYDIITMGDIVEHVDKMVGLKLLRLANDHCDKGMIITTPIDFRKQGLYQWIPSSEHKSHWTEIDFAPYAHRIEFICAHMLVKIYK